MTRDENVHSEIPKMFSEDSFEQLIPGELTD